MKKLVAMLVILFMFITTFTFSQTIKTEVYTNAIYGVDTLWNAGTNGKGESTFNLKDVFLGVDYGFTENFSANVTLRYNNDKVDIYTASIKYQTTISKDLDLNLSLGRTESFWYGYTNALWGNYSVDNVLSHKFGFVDRTKTGVTAVLVNKNVLGALEISNDKVNNKNKALGFSIVLLPVDNLKIGGFFNTYKELNIVNNSYGGSIFYKLNTKNIGSINLYGEVDFKKSVEDFPVKAEAFSLWGEYFFKESPFSVLVKFDNYLAYGITQEQSLLGGINYSPTKSYKFGLNWHNYNNLKMSKSHNELGFTASFIL